MAVKDEIDIANMIMNKPRVHMGHDAAKHIPGGSSTGPSFQPQQMAEEITVQDVRRPPTKPQITRQEAVQVQRDMAVAGKIMGNQQQLTEDVGFEQAVENLFESVNTINRSIDVYANTAGRVSQRMVEKWDNAIRALKDFELYYDRTMNRMT